MIYFKLLWVWISFSHCVDCWTTVHDASAYNFMQCISLDRGMLYPRIQCPPTAQLRVSFYPGLALFQTNLYIFEWNTMSAKTILYAFILFWYSCRVLHFHKLATRKISWAASSEFVSSSIPSWQSSTAHAQPFRGARDMAFCLKVPLDALLVWASSGGSGETARMRRLAWTFAARIGDKYQIRLTRPS